MLLLGTRGVSLWASIFYTYRKIEWKEKKISPQVDRGV